MKELRNSVDKECIFDDLKKAKLYFKPSAETLEEHAAEFLGDPEDFEEYIAKHTEYVEEIENAKTLEELADVLNEYADIYGNGSRYSVYEF